MLGFELDRIVRLATPGKNGFLVSDTFLFYEMLDYTVVFW